VKENASECTISSKNVKISDNGSPDPSSNGEKTPVATLSHPL